MSERPEEIPAGWHSPLPPPETLAEYNEIVPGAAEHILSMTEQIVAGKIDAASKLTDAEIQAAKTSLSVTTGLILLPFAAAVVFFALGNQIAGLASASFSMVMFIRSFLARPDHIQTASDPLSVPADPARSEHDSHPGSTA